MTKTEHNTKEKILDVAIIMFAEKGYKSSSIRDIAKEADVNIASINYHFKSKKELLNAVFERAFSDISEAAQLLADNEKLGFVDLCGRLFEHLLRDRYKYFNLFKLHFLDGAIDSDLEKFGENDDMTGPPGGSAIIASLQRSLDRDIDDKTAKWALQTMAAMIFHFAAFFSSPCAETKRCQNITTEAEVKENIKRTAKMILASLEK